MNNKGLQWSQVVTLCESSTSQTKVQMNNVRMLINYSCLRQDLPLKGFPASFLVLRPKEELNLRVGMSGGKGPHSQNQKLQNMVY